MYRAFFVGLPVVIVAVLAASCGSGDTNLFGSGGAGGTGSASTGAHPHSTSTSASTGSANGGGGAASTSSSAGGGVPSSGIISQSAESALESETHVAIAPNGFVCATWIAEQPGGGSTSGYRFSKDRGATWEAVAQAASPSPEVASDPVLAVDQQHNFWLTWVGFQFGGGGQPFDMHVYVAKAPAGTTTFGAPVEVTSNPAGTDAYDKPWIAVTNKNTILVTYAVTSSGAVQAARSADDGQSWTTTVIANDGAFRNLLYPCPPATGNRVYVTYVAPAGIGLRWSDDDGLSFPDTNKSAVADVGEQPGFDDPTCASEGNDIWVSYGLSMDGFDTNNSPRLSAIRVAHSADGGVTFGTHVDAHDPAAGAYFMHPQLVREPGGAAFDMVYYAGMDDGDTAGSYRRSRSLDGLTWAASASVKSPMLFTTDRTSPLWLGDYVGLAYDGGFIYTTYADNTVDMYSHIGFAKIAVP